MRRIAFVVLIVQVSFIVSRLFAGDTAQSEDELTRLKREYADVLALQGTAKNEILTIARILRANPKIAIDQTSASGEYCFNSGLGTMVHFATQPERTPEDIVYEFDASTLISAGLDPTRLQSLPERGQMTPGVWYFFQKESEIRITHMQWRAHDSDCRQREVITDCRLNPFGGGPVATDARRRSAEPDDGRNRSGRSHSVSDVTAFWPFTSNARKLRRILVRRIADMKAILRTVCSFDLGLPSSWSGTEGTPTDRTNVPGQQLHLRRY